MAQEKIIKYKPAALSKITGISKPTIDKRFISPYAKERWGVVIRKRPDGSFERYVPKDKLYLWTNSINYVGRPVFSKKEK